MFPILLHIGPVTLHTYGLMVAIGFLVAFTYAGFEFDRLGLPSYMLDRLVLYLMLAGLVGARLFYFLSEDMSSLRMDPLSFFRIWEGGLVFFGAVVFGFAALFIYAAYHELSRLTLADAFSAPLLLGHAIGRLGCFAAGCCYGKPTNSFLGVVFKNPETLAPRFVSLHPTQLYSSLGDFILFLGAVAISKRSPQRGVLFTYYLLGYGAFRFLIEFLRDDDRGVFFHGLSPAQWIALLLMAAGMGLAAYVHQQKET
jgi:phosphatidylglycerol:prolipoprotein diacylglycerol transferase